MKREGGGENGSVYWEWCVRSVQISGTMLWTAIFLSCALAIPYIVRSFIQLPVSHEPSTFMNVRQLTEKLIESRPNYMIVFDFAVAAGVLRELVPYLHFPS